jgi:hypothetical protein
VGQTESELALIVRGEAEDRLAEFEQRISS